VTAVSAPIWQPSVERVRSANLTAFVERLRESGVSGLEGYAALHAWSVRNTAAFWTAAWEFCGIRASRSGAPVVDDAARMPGARWFHGARLNFAENLLRSRDDEPALVSWNEQGPYRRLTHETLYEEVARAARGLRGLGVRAGDRVAGFMPNIPETVIAMLATSSIGAVWSSCSPDFGVRGVLDRFGQIEPKVLFATDGTVWAGKRIDLRDRVAAIGQAIDSLERIVMVPYPEPGSGPGRVGALAYAELLGDEPAGDIPFEQLPFDHPLYIMYSSGTTGLPKCMVHGAGGTLIQHLKELVLHTDLRRGDRAFYYTTCGWMMWNWLVSALAADVAVLLFDGSPFHATKSVLFDMAEREEMTVFGTSAKYLAMAEKHGLRPASTHNLASLRTMLSTGSPLAPASYDWVYDQVKRDLCLASISGGTDLISCFALGNPIGPVYRGELQALGLGMKVEVFDPGGRPLIGEKGELVCTQAFPSMPVGFWDDPHGERYRAAYFEHYPGVWRHGDWAEITPRGGLVIHGRSDATLNPGGVRIGTAEIYRQVEQLDDVLEGVVVGQEWEDDVRVVLFVRLREGVVLDETLEAKIRSGIRRNASPRHVPAKIVPVADIPRTISGKISELAVREAVHGRPVHNTDALANPEELDLYRDLPQLRD
jgi:acetoacetyl-CoA synthetase